MICPTDQILDRFFDGELSPIEHAGMAEHVAQCPACQAVVTEYQRLGNLIRGAKLAEPSIAAQARWLNSFNAARDHSVRTFAGALAAAAAIIIAVTVAIPSSAQATSAPADWEQVAVAGSTDVNQTPQGTAQWIVADLSVGGGK